MDDTHLDSPSETPMEIAALGGRTRSSIIQGRREIVEIDLSSRNVHDHQLHVILNFPFVRAVILDGNPVTAKSIDDLAKCSRLTSLSMSETALRPGDLQGLKRLPTLESLRLINVSINTPDLASICGLPVLRELQIECSNLNKGLGELRQATKLRRLTIETGGRAANLIGIGECNSLEVLVLVDLDCSKVKLFEGDRLKNIVHLSAMGCKSARSLCRVVPQLPSLKYLQLGISDVTDVDLEMIAKARSLRALALDHTAITDAGLKKIARLPELRKLWIYNTAVGDDGVQALKEAVNLEVLLITGTMVTDKSIETFQSMKRLNEIDIGHTKITVAGISRLKTALPRTAIKW